MFDLYENAYATIRLRYKTYKLIQVPEIMNKLLSQEHKDKKYLFELHKVWLIWDCLDLGNYSDELGDFRVIQNSRNNE